MADEALIRAIGRCRAQIDDDPTLDDEQAMFRVGDVRCLIDAIAQLRSPAAPLCEAADDPAHGGRFTVEDLDGVGTGAAFRVRGYDRDGNLLREALLHGYVSLQIECSAWRSRGAQRMELKDGGRPATIQHGTAGG